MIMRIAAMISLRRARTALSGSGMQIDMLDTHPTLFLVEAAEEIHHVADECFPERPAPLRDCLKTRGRASFGAALAPRNA